MELKKSASSVVFSLIIIVNLLGCKRISENVQKQKPNVLIILTDDQGWGDLGVHGNEVIETPNLDLFAGVSTEFERFYVSPVCAPTRASILTGRYHLKTGTSWVTHREEVMRSDEVTMAELLGANGYRTGCYGKWHNGQQYPYDPIGQGFQQFFGFKEGHLNNYFNTRLTHNFEDVETKGYVPDLLADSAISFIQQDKPFFCYLAFNTPHSPFQVPDAYFEKYKEKGLDDKTAAVYAMVENIDWNVGRVLEALKKSGKEEETIVIFLSDNGPNGQRFNGGFKGIKASVDEGGIRVPFFIRFPAGGVQQGSVSRQFAAHIDLLPTIAELTGITIPDTLNIDGKSMLPMLNEADLAYPEREFYTHQVNREFDTIPGAVRTHEFALTLMPGDTALYNLILDPYQKNNLHEQRPELAKNLHDKYINWFKEATQKGVDPPLVLLGDPDSKLIELPAPDAQLFGSVTFMGGEGWSNDWLINFKNKSDAAVWNVQAIKPIDYYISIQMANDNPVKIALEVDGKKYLKNIESSNKAVLIPNQDRVVRGEVEEMKWPELTLVQVRIPAGLHQLKIRPVEAVDGEVMIKALKLRPAEKIAQKKK